jgi:hypothetical protein
VVADSEIDAVMSGVVQTVKAEVPELNVYPHVVPNVVMPALMTYPPDEITYGETFDDGATMLFVVRIYVPQKQDGTDQAQLNHYISRTGPKSVVQAISEHPTLGGAVADARVVSAANYGNWPIGPTTYLGVELRIQAVLP